MSLFVHSGMAAIDLSMPTTWEAQGWDSLSGLLGSGKYPNLALSKSPAFERNRSGLWLPKSLAASLWASSFNSIYASTVSAGIVIGPNAAPIHLSGISSWMTAAPVPPPAIQPTLLIPTKRDMPVIGFRSWTVTTRKKFWGGHGYALKSLAYPGEWKPGITKAKCPTVSHEAPNEFCSCGLYVLARLKEVTRWGANQTTVTGAVMGWGRVIQHDDEGWRAEFARPIAFLDTNTYGDQPDLQDIADQYGVPLLDRKNLELYVKEFGDPLEGQK